MRKGLGNHRGFPNGIRKTGFARLRRTVGFEAFMPLEQICSKHLLNLAEILISAKRSFRSSAG